MPVINHKNLPETKGYYSKITNRNIVTAESGASFTLWEQTIPPGGYIVSHYHDFEETLTFLNGRVQVIIEDEQFNIEGVTTVYIRPNVVHSVTNPGDEPVRLIALLMTAEPKVIYPNGTPPPVDWEVD